MLKKNDYVINKAHGLCQIVDVCIPEKMLNEGTVENLASLVKCLYDKEIPVKDSNYTNILKTAETLYLTELGFALGETDESIKELILAQV